MANGGLLHGLKLHSLRFRLVVLIIVAFLPVTCASLYVGKEYHDNEVARIQQDALALVRLAADDQKELITRSTPPLLRLLASLYPEVKAQDGPKTSTLFARILAEYPQYINIMAADATTGKVFASGLPSSKPLNLADRAYFPRILHTKKYVIGEFALGKATGKPTLTCGVPVLDNDGTVRSVIVVGIDVERLAKHVAEIQPNKDAIITLLDRNGTILLNSRGHASWVGRDISRSAIWSAIHSAKGEGLYNGASFDGVEKLAAFKPLVGAVGKGDGYVLATISKETAAHMANRFMGHNLIGLLAGTGLALLGGLLVSQRSILRNVDSLVLTAERLAEGDLAVRTDRVGNTEEFARLAHSFDMMAEKLSQREAAQKLAERELFDEKERLMVTLRSIGDGVITTDNAGRVILLNTMAEKLTGWTQEEAAGKPLTDVFHIINEKSRHRCENPVEKVLQTGAIVELANHTALITKDGRELIIADSGAPIRDRDNAVIGVVLVFRDITEKQRIEDELIKADKLDSLGVLAGGIAHDFNNLLTAILGNISLSRLDARDDSAIADMLAKAEKATLRARDLTNQLLAFTRGGALQKKTIALDELIVETARFVLSGSHVVCTFELPADLWPVEIDEGQFSQVINNLILNAVQAMPEGGSITISGENCVIGLDAAIPLPAKRYVKIAIRDEGHGIPGEHLEKIFDPYFTTKREGLGLGLASSYYIIKRHEGYMTVDSRPGSGSTFYIYLPATDETPRRETETPPRFSGSGKLLVMDDEEMVRNVVGKMLSRIGFEVDYAEDGREAVDKYRAALASGSCYAGAIMDLTIPGGMGGREATALILEMDPNARVFASSGYSNDAVMAEAIKHGFCGVIPKPYVFEEMRKALCEALSGSEKGDGNG